MGHQASLQIGCRQSFAERLASGSVDMMLYHLDSMFSVMTIERDIERECLFGGQISGSLKG